MHSFVDKLSIRSKSIHAFIIYDRQYDRQILANYRKNVKLYLELQLLKRITDKDNRRTNLS